MSDTPQGGRPLARFRLFGVPVHIDLSFVIVMAILAFASGFGPTDVLLWLAITPVAVLTHELGHAAVARSAGGRPAIALAGFGGQTVLNVPGSLSRARSIAISLAGPFVGLAMGAVLLGIGRWAPPQSTTGSDALSIATFVTLGWSVLNLLPILPLDGGQTMRELLPGADEQRSRRAAAVSVVVAIAAAVVLLQRTHSYFVPLFFGWFALSNLMAMRGPPPVGAGTGPPVAGALAGPDTGAGPESAVVALLWRGDAAGARALMAGMPVGAVADMAVHGAVLATSGEPVQGFALIQQEAARRPDDVNPLALLVLAHTLRHEWDAVLALLAGPRGRQVPAAVIDRAVREAGTAQAADVAARIAAARARA